MKRNDSWIRKKTIFYILYISCGVRDKSKIKTIHIGLVKILLVYAESKGLYYCVVKSLENPNYTYHFLDPL